MSGWYNEGIKGVADGGIDYLTDPIKVLLVKDTFTFNPDHVHVSDLVAHEVSGTGYSRLTLSGKTITKNEGADRTELSATALAWSLLQVTAFIKAAILFKDTGNDATSVLLACLDGGGFPVNGNGIALTIQPNLGGFLQLVKGA